MVPAFLCIDVEHDAFEPVPGDGPWEGFAAAVRLIERLREPLGDRSGQAPHPTWFLRTDPIVGRCFGRTDYVVHRHPDLVERLRSRGAPFGIHVHALPWDEERGIGYSDYADPTWGAHCVEVAAGAFARSFGESPRRCRHGAYFFSESVVDATVKAGIRVDLTPEPGVEAMESEPSFGRGATAPSTDFRACPCHPYRPSRDNAQVPAAAGEEARPLVVIPVTAYDYRSALRPLRRRIVDRLLGRRRPALPLNPWKPWPDPGTFWDLAARAVDEGPVPYLALAIRSDPPRSAPQERVQRLLEHLPRHPIASRLAFVDPLTFWPDPPAQNK